MNSETFCQLIHGDCLDAMDDLIRKGVRVDLIVTDPPYLINYKSGFRKDHDFCTPIQGDNDAGLIKAYIEKCFALMKDNSAMYMFCSSTKVDVFKQELEKYFNVKNMIIWKKNGHTVGDLQAAFGRTYEVIFLVNKGRKFFNGKRITDFWEFKRVSPKIQIHQNQKPLELIELAIEKHSDEGDIVFDGFMGSGTTGVAAKRLNRNFIGVEIEHKYFHMAIDRIHQETSSFGAVIIERQKNDLEEGA